MSDGNSRGRSVDEAAERDAARMATVDAKLSEHTCTRCMGPVGSKCYLRKCEPAKRDSEAQAVVDAREVTAAMLDDRIVLEGPELTAYRAFQAAAREAQQAQVAMATSGQALRDAFQALCAVTAPGAK